MAYLLLGFWLSRGCRQIQEGGCGVRIKVPVYSFKKNVTKRGEIKDVHSFYFILAVSTNIMQSIFELVVVLECLDSI